MLQRSDMLKNHCCVLFGDLKVLLLRPSAPVRLSIHMSRDTPDPIATPSVSGVADNKNTCRAHLEPREIAAPPVGGASGPERDGQVGGSGCVDVDEPSGVLRCSSSSEQRFSMCSYSESGGVRSPLCRICFQGPETGELLSPCRCSGSVRCTHQPCLIKWISERGSWACELCYYKYQVIAISTKNPLQWQSISLTVTERVQIAATLLGSLFLMASLSWLIWSSFSSSARWQRQDLLFQICYGMHGFMDIVCTALIFHEGPSVFRILRRWQTVNQQWKVLNYDKTTDSKDLKTAATDRTQCQSEPRIQAVNGLGRSTSPTSPVALAPRVVNLVPDPGTTRTTAQGSSETSGMVGPDQSSVAYSIFHVISHLRQSEPGGHLSHGTHELVMRVTTV
ncbi:hypothetical protein DPEC_G00135280 [Dallia pectoralis]|uniref:Uncharacterized protein n=1 Tax=Dallia pectoralis TaxID=75939 RepID=A0ACC2GL63_DALPE|nr:hypothetical protein DPEC_G00135280 [Dallia pectoralis]